MSPRKKNALSYEKSLFPTNDCPEGEWKVIHCKRVSAIERIHKFGLELIIEQFLQHPTNMPAEVLFSSS